MFADCLCNLVANPERRVERGHRFLKDHRDAVTSHGAQRLSWCRQQVGPLKPRGPALDPERRAIQEPHQREGGQALSATGLSHDAKRFAGVQLKAHAIDQGLRRGPDSDRQAIHLQKRPLLGHGRPSIDLRRLSNNVSRCSRMAFAAAVPSRASMASMIFWC